MEDLSKKIKKLSLKQGAIKILINSIYGAFGNKWFYFYNPDIAQSITLQGQDLIKFSIKAVNFYFKERWHLDKELHEILGVADRTINKVNDDAAIYTDTDSIYIQFDSALKSIEGLELSTDEYLQMCIKIDEHRLSDYFDQCFNKWSKVFNTENRQTFKLELIAENGFWIKKKNYALKVSYEPNPKQDLYSDKDRYLLIKGLEPIKSSYPIWARNHQLKFIEYLLERGDQVSLEEELIPMIKEVLKEFLTLNPDEVAMNFNIRQYDKYVASEKDGTLKKGATPYPKAVMHHNHLIIKNKLEDRYQRLREGGKVKFIYCKYNSDLDVDVFAYRPGEYPIEIAPEMDMIQHFFILIVEPINRVLGAIGVNQIDKHLKRAVEFKTSKSKNPLTDDQLYPLHVIDSETLQHEEVPEKFWKTIGNPDAVISDDEYGEYLSVITKYGLNTVVLINKNLKPYINRISKNQKLNGTGV
jgi:DNA polymerase elongation subunit (family B)